MTEKHTAGRMRRAVLAATILSIGILGGGTAAWLAGSLAVTGETTWRLLRLSSRPPLTRFAYWASAQECTIRIDKARSELGYEPVKSRPDGLAELRG